MNNLLFYFIENELFICLSVLLPVNNSLKVFFFSERSADIFVASKTIKP